MLGGELHYTKLPGIRNADKINTLSSLHWNIAFMLLWRAKCATPRKTE